MILSKVAEVKDEGKRVKIGVDTTYSGSEEELTYEFLTILKDGYSDSDLRPAFNKAFKMFEEEVTHEY